MFTFSTCQIDHKAKANYKNQTRGKMADNHTTATTTNTTMPGRWQNLALAVNLWATILAAATACWNHNRHEVRKASEPYNKTQPVSPQPVAPKQPASKKQPAPQHTQQQNELAQHLAPLSEQQLELICICMGVPISTVAKASNRDVMLQNMLQSTGGADEAAIGKYRELLESLDLPTSTQLRQVLIDTQATLLQKVAWKDTHPCATWANCNVSSKTHKCTGQLVCPYRRLPTTACFLYATCGYCPKHHHTGAQAPLEPFMHIKGICTGFCHALPHPTLPITLVMPRDPPFALLPFAHGDIDRTVAAATALVETMDTMSAARDNSRFASAEAQANAGTDARKAERINRSADSAASRYAPRRRLQ